MSALLKFFKTWMLPIGMTTGALSYVAYHSLGFLHPIGPACLLAVKKIQPVLLFIMLFLAFCRIEPSSMRPRRWHLRLLAIQGLSFGLLGLLLVLFPQLPARVVVESAMICLICPTATAATVITDRLGGDMAGLAVYTILINLLTSIAVPLVVPLVYPVAGVTFFTAFVRIMLKVFPLLICPCLLAWLVRWLMPHVHAWLIRYKDLPFYIWAVSLVLAILMTTRAIYHSSASFALLAGIGIASLLSCIFQFWAGKSIGRRFLAEGGKTEEITAGQSLGQKNTVFAIWMGYTFLDPVTSVAGGFYSIWHNCFNSWQLYRHDKSKAA